MLVESSIFLKRVAPEAARLVQALVDAWKDAALQRGGLPLRQDMSPARLRGLTQHISLFDYDGETLKFRLASREVTARIHQDPIGFNVLDVLDPKILPAVQRRLRLAATHPCGYAASYRLQQPNGNHNVAAIILLPLTDHVGNDAAHFIRMEHMGAMVDWRPEGRDEVYIDEDQAFGSAFDLGFGLPDEFSNEILGADAAMNISGGRSL
ncbi:PAS domain-containing protein [Pseudokordiimonas caeni]|uniref:PAS domain-containing protein n=1 Tax=Pseudokordiimonas caeni TaxID=2997908 RepID=UPI002812740B|nr:PAS domain-containing protein [Pseudokordiimonas caeni]